MTNQDTTPKQPSDLGIHSRTEILNQIESWQYAIDAISAARANLTTLFTQHSSHPILYVGCGSPYYLALSAAAVYRETTGRLAIAAPASELLYNYKSLVPGSTTPLVIAISRSGETSELLVACKQLKQRMGSKLVAITVSQNTSLTRLADIVVYISGASEYSVAQTRSFSAMLLATLGTIAIAANNQNLWLDLQAVPATAYSYIDRIQAPIAELMTYPISRVFFLGSGLFYGLANEGALKMKEMSLTNAEPFHFMEFRHGPQSMVDEQTLVVGLVSRHAREIEMTVLREMRKLGGTVLAISSTPTGIRDHRFLEIGIDSVKTDMASLVFYMPVLQLLAYNQAMRKGLDCDNPRNLHAYIRLPNLESELGS